MTKQKIIASKNKYIKNQRSPFLMDEKNEEFDKKLIIQMIHDLNKSLNQITLKSLGLNKAASPCPILSERLQKPCSRKFLYHTACLHFGSWNLALEACQLKTIKPSYNKFWTPTLIVKSIKALHKSGHTLMAKDIYRDRKRPTTKVLFEITGKKTTGSALHDSARRNFGSWDKALTKAGIKIENIKEKPF